MFTIDDIARCAAKQEQPLEELSLAEWLLFYRLKDIFRAYADKKINKHEGALEKNIALQQYEKDKIILENAEQIIDAHAQMWKTIDKAASAYCKNPCIETADNFFEAVYGVRRKKTESERL